MNHLCPLSCLQDDSYQKSFHKKKMWRVNCLLSITMLFINISGIYIYMYDVLLGGGESLLSFPDDIVSHVDLSVKNNKF